MQTYQQFKQAQTVTDLYEAPDAKDYHKWVQEANRISDPATYVINDENDFDDGEPNYLEKKRQEMEEAKAQFEPGEPPEIPPDDDGGPGPWGEDLSKSAPKPKVEAPPPSPVDTARQSNPGMAISNTGNFKQTGTLPNGTKFVQAGNNVNTIKTPQQMMSGGRTTKLVQAPLVKTQSYNDFKKRADYIGNLGWYYRRAERDANDKGTHFEQQLAKFERLKKDVALMMAGAKQLSSGYSGESTLSSADKTKPVQALYMSSPSLKKDKIWGYRHDWDNPDLLTWKEWLRRAGNAIRRDKRYIAREVRNGVKDPWPRELESHMENAGTFYAKNGEDNIGSTEPKSGADSDIVALIDEAYPNGTAPKTIAKIRNMADTSFRRMKDINDEIKKVRATVGYDYSPMENELDEEWDDLHDKFDKNFSSELKKVQSYQAFKKEADYIGSLDDWLVSHDSRVKAPEQTYAPGISDRAKEFQEGLAYDVARWRYLHDAMKGLKAGKDTMLDMDASDYEPILDSEKGKRLKSLIVETPYGQNALPWKDWKTFMNSLVKRDQQKLKRNNEHSVDLVNWALRNAGLYYAKTGENSLGGYVSWASPDRLRKLVDLAYAGEEIPENIKKHLTTQDKVAMQTYEEFIKTAADEQAPWYTGIQDWIKENPNLAAGGTALLAAAPLYLLGRGFGKKRDRLLGLLTAVAGGGAAFYGMKNWGVPWLAGLGQATATTAPAPSKGSNTVMPTNTYGFNPHAAPAEQPVKTQAQQKQAPVKTQQPASNTVPVANGGGKRTDAYVKGIQQFRQNMEAKFGPADKWKPELLQHYQLQAKNFFNDPTYKMQLPGK